MTTEDDPQAWVSLDALFHTAIARASGNKVFESIIVEIRDAMANQSETLNMLTDRKYASSEEHGRIFHAIEDRDPTAASAAMAEHLSAVGVTLDTLLNRK